MKWKKRRSGNFLALPSVLLQMVCQVMQVRGSSLTVLDQGLVKGVSEEKCCRSFDEMKEGKDGSVSFLQMLHKNIRKTRANIRGSIFSFLFLCSIPFTLNLVEDRIYTPFAKAKGKRQSTGAEEI
jgi:hypothetical protein